MRGHGPAYSVRQGHVRRDAVRPRERPEVIVERVVFLHDDDYVLNRGRVCGDGRGGLGYLRRHERRGNRGQRAKRGREEDKSDPATLGCAEVMPLDR